VVVVVVVGGGGGGSSVVTAVNIESGIVCVVVVIISRMAPRIGRLGLPNPSNLKARTGTASLRKSDATREPRTLEGHAGVNENNQTALGFETPRLEIVRVEIARTARTSTFLQTGWGQASCLLRERPQIPYILPLVCSKCDMSCRALPISWMFTFIACSLTGKSLRSQCVVSENS